MKILNFPLISAMSVSVIIPTFNRSEVLPRALISVLNQTHKPDEIIVIDDGSRDGTSEMMATDFPEITYISQDNKGVSSARNVGIHQSSGDFIAFLDSDDEWEPMKLEKQVSVLKSSPESALVHTDEKWVRNGKFVNPKRTHKKYGGWVFPQCVDVCFISPSATLIRRSVLNEVGFFDENFPVCEDYDLWLRIASQFPVAFLQDLLTIKYGGHLDQLSTKMWGMDRFRVRSVVKLLESRIDLKTEWKNYAIVATHRRIAVLQKGAQKHNNQHLIDEIVEFEKILKKIESYS